VFENIRRDWRVNSQSSAYLSFLALLVYRFGVWAASRRPGAVRWALGNVYGLVRFIVASFTGIHLERETTVGEGLHLIHGGVVHIHPAAVIGDRVGVMHGVTIGTNVGPEVPVIGNDVFIGVNASILGKVIVGDGARIAANSLVIADVPPGAFAIGVPARAMVVGRVRSEKKKAPGGNAAPGGSDAGPGDG
jgi:serine O-acetyltransferase